VLTAKSLAAAADEVIQARALELAREAVSRELLGTAMLQTGDQLYNEFVSSVPPLWHAVDLRCQEAFVVLVGNASKIPIGYSDAEAWNDPDESRQTAWRLVAAAVDSIGIAHGIRQRWRVYGFLARCRHDAADEYGMVENYAQIGGSLVVPASVGQTSVDYLLAAVRAGGRLWLPIAADQDRAYLAGTVEQSTPSLTGGSLVYAD
jgi:hypothetical protein